MQLGVEFMSTICSKKVTDIRKIRQATASLGGEAQVRAVWTRRIAASPVVRSLAPSRTVPHSPRQTVCQGAS